MIIAGRHDAGTTVENAEFVRSRIPRASMTVLDAAHIANVELPYDYTERVLGFLLQK
jgi:3-oxoadipate enol-lactonase